MPEIDLYDLTDVAHALGKKPSGDPSDDGGLDAMMDAAMKRPAFRVKSADSDRDELLQAMLDDPRGPARRLAVADHDTLCAIDAVLRNAPNLDEAIGLVRRAATLLASLNTGTTTLNSGVAASRTEVGYTGFRAAS